MPKVTLQSLSTKVGEIGDCDMKIAALQVLEDDTVVFEMFMSYHLATKYMSTMNSVRDSSSDNIMLIVTSDMVAGDGIQEEVVGLDAQMLHRSESKVALIDMEEL